MSKPWIGPIDKALYDAISFGEGMAKAHLINQMLKQIDSLTTLLEDDKLEETHRKVTELLLEQLEQTFYDTIIPVPVDEDSENGRTNI